MASQKNLALPATGRTPMPSLPAWLSSRVSAMATNLQRDPATGKWHEPLTLRPELALTDQQRQAVQTRIQSSTSLLDQSLTPIGSKDADKAMFTLVTNLMLAKPSRAGGPATSTARGDAYLAALDDVPTWAVEQAIRKWHRGECDRPFENPPVTFDYTWAPEAADLRRLARREVYAVKDEIAKLENLLVAVPLIDCEADLARGRAAMRGLRKMIGGTPGSLDTMTFDQAAEIGAQMPDRIEPEPQRRAAE